MQSLNQKNEQMRWNRLLLKFKVVLFAPVACAIVLSIATNYFVANVLGVVLGISSTEPVIRNPNGQLFMVLLMTGIVLLLFLYAAIGYLIICFYLMRTSQCSWKKALHMVAKTEYPLAWYIEGNPGA